ncbi:exodeoxyribonuclease VII small subunit [Brachybacterium sp. YJGR34]|uniref:exodeoxyribonuclease VII small subunit n=1 Tax=Brachybacterium sp. YJGR34 TaxID=2059911 RepID=UPI000E0B6AEC|nr:exodeoxyribonuclease VII small subunit [Brachybacterium sp. YJGR34]
MTASTSPEDDLTAAEGDPTDTAQPAVTPAESEQPLPADIAALSYEAARDQLVEVVRRLESGQGGLEDSIALWERGEMLARRCQQWLDGARERLDDAVAARRAGDAPER